MGVMEGRGDTELDNQGRLGAGEEFGSGFEGGGKGQMKLVLGMAALGH